MTFYSERVNVDTFPIRIMTDNFDDDSRYYEISSAITSTDHQLHPLSSAKCGELNLGYNKRFHCLFQDKASKAKTSIDNSGTTGLQIILVISHGKF